MPVGDPKASSHRTAAATRAAAPMVEVPLTCVRPRTPGPIAARLNIAWLLFGAFGVATLLATTVPVPRTGAPHSAGLVVPLYALTIGALVWAAVEILRPRQ
jgi:hypothetical protein